MSDFCEKSQGFDYIFGRMSAIYGNDFARKWDGIDANLIRQEWLYHRLKVLDIESCSKGINLGKMCVYYNIIG